MSDENQTSRAFDTKKERPGKYSTVFFIYYHLLVSLLDIFPVSVSLYNYEEQLWPPEENTQGPNSIYFNKNLIKW